MSKGDVTVRKGMMMVLITAEDQRMEPDALADYLEHGYEIYRDEREDEENED